ncbi:ExbD/TolR family protein [Flavobacterium urocaniciphilum]|uniref:Outer membrane transport energization protein ExbD n=1 Tax=Flavobacterium urocaniciphilum TaxID=1299341 RepID=A0A1H9C3P5_9FLAO|nr:biopolymer transporter ExbD [Flavobacterium urocaniciphilum]SEP95298.1 outer membrane transport energization protein ExbD [Flavobacterium urocaniciphilum]
MAKVKISKKSTKIDMTAMCDVAFLLLSFFIMTSTAKVPEPKPVDTPASTVKAKLPERNLATITIGDSAVFFGVSERETRIAMLEKMAAQYNMEFTDEEKQEFSKIDGFGVSMSELKALIKLSSAERNNEGTQKGIPFKDSTDNQLADWVKAAREASFELSEMKGKKEELQVAIKGDSKEKYPTVKKVLDLLQKQEVNKFFLVTGLRSEDF